MYSTRSLSVSSSCILILFFLVSAYYGIFSPPPLITYTTDENFIGESGIFLLYGNTPRALEWAAIPSTLIAYFLFLVWCCVKLVTGISSIKSIGDVLEIVDKNAYYYLNHREEFVVWERWVQLLIVFIILFQTAKFIIKSKHQALTESVKFILIFLSLSADVIWLYAPVIRPEALSGSLFIYTLYRLFFSAKINLNSALFILFLFILTVTQRLIFVFLTPFVVGSLIVYLRDEKYKCRDYLKYIFFFFISLLSLMPFLITDLFVVLKSFLGGVFSKLNHNKMETFFNMDYINAFFEKPFNIVLSVLSLFGTYFIFKFYNKKIIIFLFLGNLLFFLYTSLKSAQLYITHTYPMAIMFLILIGYGLVGLVNLLKESNKKWAVLTIAVLLCLNTLGEIYANNSAIYSQQKNIADVISWVKSTSNNEKIALPLDFDGLLPKNKACLLREYKANASEKYRFEKLSKLLKIPVSDSISKFSLPIIAQSFAFEDERLFDTQYQVALKYIDTDSDKKFDTDYYFFKTDNMSHCILKSEAMKGFNEGKYHYFVSGEKLDEFTPIKSFENQGGINFWVYEKK